MAKLRENWLDTPPKGSASACYRTAAETYRTRLPWILAGGAVTAAVQYALGLLPTWAAAGAGLLLAPVCILGVWRLYLELLCGKNPRFDRMLCACKGVKVWALALTLGLPRFAYLLLGGALSVANEGLTAAGQTQTTAGLSVSLGLLVLQLVWLFWYPYRLGHLNYIWLTGRGKALGDAARLSMARTRGTLRFWLPWFMAYYLIQLAMAMLPGMAVSALGQAAGTAADAAMLLNGTGVLLTLLVQPFLDLASLCFSACYFGGTDKEFASTEGFV